MQNNHPPHFNRSAPSYEHLFAIPNRISQMKKRESIGTQAAAIWFECELIVWFLLVLCWRAATMCGCRIGGPRPNLYKAVPNQKLGLPNWVLDEITHHPHAEFWQYKFPWKSKNVGDEISGFIPPQLCLLIEAYLTIHRPVLVGDHDPGTLFVDRRGHAFSFSAFGKLVGDLTARFSGTRVHVGDFRRAFILKWLNSHPDNIVELQRLLWHRSIRMTLKYFIRFPRKDS
jgi:hypothetical protein